MVVISNNCRITFEIFMACFDHPSIFLVLLCLSCCLECVVSLALSDPTSLKCKDCEDDKECQTEKHKNCNGPKEEFYCGTMWSTESKTLQYSRCKRKDDPDWEFIGGVGKCEMHPDIPKTWACLCNNADFCNTETMPGSGSLVKSSAWTCLLLVIIGGWVG